MNIMKKKKRVDKNGRKYISFRIDVYFNKFLLAVEIDEKGHTNKDLIFEEKRQESLEKTLGSKFIRINTSNATNGYDLYCEIGNIEAFIDEFQNKKTKEVKDENKELKSKNKEFEEKLEKEKEAGIKKLKGENKKLKKNQPH